MQLVIAEKPSVAMALSKVLGAKSRGDGYMEGGGWLVSWCIGHLVELAPADAYDPRYSKWNYADLPILPEPWQYQVLPDTKKQFETLKSLMHRADVTALVPPLVKRGTPLKVVDVPMRPISSFKASISEFIIAR